MIFLTGGKNESENESENESGRQEAEKFSEMIFVCITKFVTISKSFNYHCLWSNAVRQPQRILLVCSSAMIAMQKKSFSFCNHLNQTIWCRLLCGARQMTAKFLLLIPFLTHWCVPKPLGFIRRASEAFGGECADYARPSAEDRSFFFKFSISSNQIYEPAMRQPLCRSPLNGGKLRARLDCTQWSNRSSLCSGSGSQKIGMQFQNWWKRWMEWWPVFFIYFSVCVTLRLTERGLQITFPCSGISGDWERRRLREKPVEERRLSATLCPWSRSGAFQKLSSKRF